MEQNEIETLDAPALEVSSEITDLGDGLTDAEAEQIIADAAGMDELDSAFSGPGPSDISADTSMFATGAPPEIGTLAIHPLCDIYPWMTVEEKKRLLDDVLECKKIEQTIVLLDNQILDGRHRRWAVLEAYNQGVEVDYDVRVFDPTTEGDPATYVSRMNGIRRMMDKGQEAIVGLKFYDRMQAEVLANKKGKGKKSLSEEERGSVSERASKLVGCGERYIRMAKEVRDADPELLAKVDAQEISLPQALKQANLITKSVNDMKEGKAGGGSTPAVDPYSVLEWEHSAWFQIDGKDGDYFISITENREPNGAITYGCSPYFCDPADGPASSDTAAIIGGTFDVTGKLAEARRKAYETCVRHATPVEAI